jgi:radical SAM superfamily enzyme YgiQ (UPF0313 family)
VKIVLISTYELGRQPFGLASPAAWLRQRAHEVASLDLARQSLDENAVRNAELIAIYLPMHTATRLAAELLPQLRKLNPHAHLCCYGLYAPMNENYLRSLGVQTILGGEFENELVHLAKRLSEPNVANHANDSPQEEPRISLERLPFVVPDRSGLPPLPKYAHLIIPGDGFRIVGSTEASRGCKHLCRHCPIVPVYDGVFRIVPRDVVMEDVRRQIATGAQHISFGDPDFFNGIGHALPLVEEFHREFPNITYDVTIKIEHLKKHQDKLAALKNHGCLFVISAVESVDDTVLTALDKGHTRSEFLEVVAAFRALGLVLHPTFVPFSPWTTLETYIELLRVLAEQGLIENVAPIQLGIRLLIPEGSRILELEEIRRSIGPFDAKSLVYPWRNSDLRVDQLSETVQAIAATADHQKLPRAAAFQQIWKVAHRAAGIAAPPLPVSSHSAQPVPFLSEPWYCCAEPTQAQLVSIGSPQPAAAEKSSVTADSFV